MSTPTVDDNDDDISLGFILGVWKQWWKLLIPVSLLLAVGGSIVILFVVPPKYRAVSTLEIAEQAPWVIHQDNSLRAQKYVATQIEMLRSARVLSAVLEDERISRMPELKGRDPVKWLSEKGLKIEPVGESTLVSVSFEGSHPESAAHLVNTVVDKYLNIEYSQKQRRARRVLEVLQQNHKVQEKHVASLQQRVRVLSKNLDVVPPLHGTPLISDLSSPAQDLMNQIMKADMEVADLEAAVSAIKSSLTEDSFIVSPSLVQAEIDSQPEIVAMRNAIQTEEGKLAKIESTAADGAASAAYIAQLSKIDRMRAQLEVERVESQEFVEKQVREMDRVSIEAKLKLSETQLEQKRKLVEKLETRYEAEKTKIAGEGETRLQFDFASQDLSRALGLLATISERQSQMQAELNAPSRPDVFHEAKPNYQPLRKYPFVELGAVCLACLVVPFGIALLWEMSVRRINSPEQLQAKTNLDVIGEISRLPTRQGGNARVVGQELGLFEESIDSLRTSLLLSHDQDDLQVIAVCSAVSGEGKTSVSSQLAVSIARATGQPVLLIDGDMRASDIHQIFDIPCSPGLADVLNQDVSLEDAINRTWSEHVHLLPAGELTKSPHKLLGTATIRNVLDEARLWYRYIVVDTPPVLAASESLVLAKEADGTVVCTMRDYSREYHVRLAQRRLQATGAATIGTVLNGVPVHTYASRYGSYGRYGYAPSQS